MKPVETISGKEEEWIVEWDGGRAIQRGITAFEAHSHVCGAPAFGSCRVWKWDGASLPDSEEQCSK